MGVDADTILKEILGHSCCLWIVPVIIGCILVENIVRALSYRVATDKPQLPDKSHFMWLFLLIGVMGASVLTGAILPDHAAINYGGLGAIALYYSYYLGYSLFALPIVGLSIFVPVAYSLGGISTLFDSVCLIFLIAAAQAGSLIVTPEYSTGFFFCGAIPMAAVYLGTLKMNKKDSLAKTGMSDCDCCMMGMLPLLGLLFISQAHWLPFVGIPKRNVRGGEAPLVSHPVLLGVLSAALTTLAALLQGMYGYIALLGAAVVLLLLWGQDQQRAVLAPCHPREDMGLAWLLTALLLCTSLVASTGDEPAQAALLATATGAVALLGFLLLVLNIIEHWVAVGSDQWRGLCFDTLLMLFILLFVESLVLGHYWDSVVTPALHETSALLVSWRDQIPAAAAAAVSARGWANHAVTQILWVLMCAGLSVLPRLSLGMLHFYSVAHSTGWANTRKVALVLECAGPRATLTRLHTSLRKMQIPSTIFVTGECARDHPAQLKALAAAGNEIGTLGMLCGGGFVRSCAEQQQQLKSSVEYIEAATGAPCRWYKAPHDYHGALAARAAASLGLRLLQASSRATATQWAEAEEGEVADILLSQMDGGGETLLLPACTSASAAAMGGGCYDVPLAKALRVADMVAGELLEKGREFCRVSEVCKDAPSFQDGADHSADGGWGANTHRKPQPSKEGKKDE